MLCRRPTPLLVPIALAMALGGCSKDRAGSSATADAGSKPKMSASSFIPGLDPIPVESAEEGSPAPGASPGASGSNGAALADAGFGSTVRVINPGAPPRRKLRYKFHVDQVETFTMDLKMAAATEMNGQKLPEMVLPVIRASMQLAPRAISPEGDCRYDYQLISTSLVPDPRTPPELAEELARDLEPLKGISGYALITSRGITKDARFQLPADREASPQGAQMLEQIQQTVRDLAAVLPEEEVGKGAQWERTSQIHTNEVTATQREVYSLKELRDDIGKVDVVLTQSAPSQSVRDPTGANVRMEQMNTNGKGTSSFDLNRIVPSSTLDATTQMALAGEQQGIKQRVKMTMKFGVKVDAQKL